MDINIIRYVFTFNAIFMATIAILLNCWESYMPIWLRRMYRYGKFSAKDHSIIAKLEVPKE